MKFWGDGTGESLFAMAALKINDSPGDLFSKLLLHVSFDHLLLIFIR